MYWSYTCKSFSSSVVTGTEAFIVVSDKDLETSSVDISACSLIAISCNFSSMTQFNRRTSPTPKRRCNLPTMDSIVTLVTRMNPPSVRIRTMPNILKDWTWPELRISWDLQSCWARVSFAAGRSITPLFPRCCGPMAYSRELCWNPARLTANQLESSTIHWSFGMGLWTFWYTVSATAFPISRVYETTMILYDRWGPNSPLRDAAPRLNTL